MPILKGQFGKRITDKIDVGGVQLDKMSIGLGGGNEFGKPLDVLGAFGMGGRGGDDDVGLRLVKLGKTKSSAFSVDLGDVNKSGMPNPPASSLQIQSTNLNHRLRNLRRHRHQKIPMPPRENHLRHRLPPHQHLRRRHPSQQHTYKHHL